MKNENISCLFKILQEYLYLENYPTLDFMKKLALKNLREILLRGFYVPCRNKG
jgi:hypothetical protein